MNTCWLGAAALNLDLQRLPASILGFVAQFYPPTHPRSRPGVADGPPEILAKARQLDDGQGAVPPRRLVWLQRPLHIGTKPCLWLLGLGSLIVKQMRWWAGWMASPRPLLNPRIGGLDGPCGCMPLCSMGFRRHLTLSSFNPSPYAIVG
jgi:hypothetical protein